MCPRDGWFRVPFAPAEFPVFPPCLSLGDTGRAVTLLQLMLRMAGIDKGIAMNGVFDEPTRCGVLDLQRMLEIEQTGVFDKAVKDALQIRRGIDLDRFLIAALEQETRFLRPGARTMSLWPERYVDRT